MNPNEIWQVDVGGQVYEASFMELTQWVTEGSLLPQDKVRRGNLRWLDAIKVPALYGFFNAKELGLAPPVLLTTSTNTEAATAPASETVQMQSGNFAPATTLSPAQFNSTNPAASPAQFEATHQAASPTQYDAQSPFNAPTNFAPTEVFPPPYQTTPQNFQADFTQPMPAANVCLIHPENEPAFYCDGCANLFCKGCPTSYGGTVKICPMCGAMCKPLEAVREQQKKAVQFHQDLAQGFGFEDFGKALAYPFKFKFSLVAGAIMFMLFTLGQSSAGVGGIWMMSASGFCLMLSNMLTFGVLANTVENMSQGKLTENFMPSFDDFNILDDVLHPFFLSIGAYIASFGLLFVIIIGGFWYMSNRAVESHGDTVADMSKRIQENREAKDEGRILPDGTVIPPFDQLTPAQKQALDDNDIDKLQEMLVEHRKANLESVVGKTPETKEKEFQQMLTQLASMGTPVLLLAFLAFLWGIFYLPAACAVAGYTRSFAATVNPMVGLDTIKRMGFDYVKILLMVFILFVASSIIGGILGFVLKAFDMPGVGNLPANAIASLFTFYFSVVFSLVLGYALYKNSAKLNLYRG
ncbi:MAG TPA: DUF4013 domain-containing protein [Pyrinomonadaceae bacterium]|jgi:hypothetical protein